MALTQSAVTHLTFDMMTVLTFDIDYHTMEQPQFRYVVPTIEESNIRLSVLWQMPELTFGHIDRKLLPQSAKAARKFAEFLRKLLKSRLEKDKIGRSDIFSFLQRCKDPDTDKGLSHKELSTETATFVVAGNILSRSLMDLYQSLTILGFFRHRHFIDDPGRISPLPHRL